MRLRKKELTNAINNKLCFGSRLVGKKMFTQIINELWEYKTIEEELGIDLITLFKALGGTIFAINTIDNLTVEEYDRYYPKTLYIGIDDEWYIQVDLDDGYFTYNAKDYGKTWALTKEELL